MRQIGMEHNIDNAISILLAFAHTPERMMIVEKYISEIRKTSKENEKMILQDIIGIIYTGMRYGNWPWSVSV